MKQYASSGGYTVKVDPLFKAIYPEASETEKESRKGENKDNME